MVCLSLPVREAVLIMQRNLLVSNFLLFQAGWFALVLGGTYGKPLTGTLIAALIIAVHLLRADKSGSEIRLLLTALVTGVLFESLLVGLHLAEYSSGLMHPGLAPYWMIILWALFATTLNVSMYWVKQLKTPWVSLLGAVLAPLTYYAGERLGAVVFPNPAYSLGAISLGWALLFPLLVNFSRRFNGYDNGQRISPPAMPLANGGSANA